MRQHGVPIERVIHGGGIPQRSEVLNRVYANVLGVPVLVPQRSVTSLGSALFAFKAAGVFTTIEDAQKALCPPYRVIEADPAEQAVYEELYAMYRQIYFALGVPGSDPVALGELLPALRTIAASAQRSTSGIES